MYCTPPERQHRVAGFLDRLGYDPPASLLLEGGCPDERQALARYWIARLNCEAPHGPCGKCPTCKQIEEGVFRDMVLLDGAQGAIPVDTVREVRARLGDPPAGNGMRVVVLAEAQELTQESANALLKSMEEPAPGNTFVLLTPNRQRLLPTLVSRSFVLTLSLAAVTGPDADAEEWVVALTGFASTGRNWFDRTARKGAVDRGLAEKVVGGLRQRLLAVLRGERTAAEAFGRELSFSVLHRIDLYCGHALDCLFAKTGPALVLDWLAVRLWRAFRQE
jgi:DNA polymerase-3 subunit delta'